MHLCGLGVGLSSAQKQSWLPFIPTRKQRKRRIPRLFAGALWAVCRCFVVDFNERNNQQSVWDVAIISSDSHPNRQDSVTEVLSNPTMLTCVLTKENTLWSVKMDCHCLNAKAERSSARTQSTNCDVCCVTMHRFCPTLLHIFCFCEEDVTRTNVNEREICSRCNLTADSVSSQHYIYVPAQYFTLTD